PTHTTPGNQTHQSHCTPAHTTQGNQTHQSQCNPVWHAHTQMTQANKQIKQIHPYALKHTLTIGSKGPRMPLHPRCLGSPLGRDPESPPAARYFSCSCRD